MAFVFMKYVVPILLFLVTWGMPTPAMAQRESDRATARSLAAEGAAALNAKDYAAAVDRFQRADALVHAPTIAVDLSRALMGLGRYVEAQERLEQVLREGVADNVPWVWKRAIQDAKKLVEEVKPKVAWLTINVKGPSRPEVTVGGVPVPNVALGVRRATDPGQFQISASAPGYLSKEETFSIPAGGERTVTLELIIDSEAKKPATVRPLVQTPLPNEHDRQPTKERSNTLGYIALGVGGAGLVVGTVTGFLFLGKHSDLASKCPDVSNCQQQGLINDYNRYGTISGVSLAVGLAGSVAGLWMIFSHESTDVTSAHSDRVAVQPYVSFDRLGIVGAY